MSADHVARSAFIEGKPSPVGAVASAVVPAPVHRLSSFVFGSVAMVIAPYPDSARLPHQEAQLRSSALLVS